MTTDNFAPVLQQLAVREGIDVTDLYIKRNGADGHPVDHGFRDKARTDLIDSDATGCVFQRCTFGKADDTAFRCVIAPMFCTA